MQDFTGKATIVTGTTGIGKAIAKRLASGGAQVLSCGIDAKANLELAQEAKAEGLTIEVRQVDVPNPEQVQAAVNEAVRLFVGLDIIVNFAAVHSFGNAQETEIDVWERCCTVYVSNIILFAHFVVLAITK